MTTIRAPKEIRHDWTLTDATGRVYQCGSCNSRTANVRAHKVDVCPAKDRRKRREDRRVGQPRY